MIFPQSRGENGLGWRQEDDTWWILTPSEPKGTSLQLEDSGISKFFQDQFLVDCLFLKGKDKKWGRLLQAPKEVEGLEDFTARVWLPTHALGKYRVVWTQLKAKQIICSETRCSMHLHYFYTFLSHPTFHEHPAHWERLQTRLLCRHCRCGGTYHRPAGPWCLS